MLKAFGPFSVVFDPIGSNRTPYLSLLRLHRPGILDIVRIIRDTASKPDSTTNAVTMLRDANWRPHLVGAIATYYCTAGAAVTQMWAALDAGSWVAPQLAGVLSLCDPNFVINAAQRLHSGCPLSGDPEYSIGSPIERHSAQGPAGSHHRSSKSASSLLELLPEDRAAEFSSNDHLQSLIADDNDGSGKIATSWLARLLKLDAQL